MTVIFMENYFQILEKNKILVKTENLCRPAPYQQWRKGAFFWYVRFVGSYSTEFGLPEFSSFLNFFSFWKKFSAFPKFGNFGQFKTKTNPAFPSWKHLPKFSSFKNFWYGPLQLLSNSQLQSQLKTTVKIWKSSKILVRRRSSC